MNDTDRVIDVAIVGGGITGLAAAYELQRRGVAVRVIEAAPRAGGVIRTDRPDGWVIDGGPDALLVQKPAAVALCRELGLGDRLMPTLLPRTAFIVRDGRLWPIAEGAFLGFPISLAALVRSPLFTWAGKLRMAAEPFVPRAEVDDESIGSFVARRFGHEAVDYLAEPLLAGIHAGDVDRLSIRALFPRLVDAERHAGSVLRSIRAMRVTPSPSGAFVSLPGGIGELVDALTGALAPGTMQLSTRATAVRHAGMFAVDTEAGAIAARAVILGLPAYGAAALLRGLDATLAGLCDGIAYASTATVAFGYRRDQIRHALQGTGFVVPRVEGGPLLAGTWVTSKWAGRAPAGSVLLRGFLGGGRDPHRIEQTDDQLIAVARDALTTLLQIDGPPQLARVYRFARQSPQHEVGHLDRVAAIERRAAGIPGLFLAGSGFRAIGIPDCIADGRDAAGRTAEYLTQGNRHNA